MGRPHINQSTQCRPRGGGDNRHAAEADAVDVAIAAGRSASRAINGNQHEFDPRLA
jgi:hypothetical protein